MFDILIPGLSGSQARLAILDISKNNISLEVIDALSSTLARMWERTYSVKHLKSKMLLFNFSNNENEDEDEEKDERNDDNDEEEVDDDEEQLENISQQARKYRKVVVSK